MLAFASPYAVCKADDLIVPPAPIGLGQSVRVRVRKRYPENASN